MPFVQCPDGTSYSQVVQIIDGWMCPGIYGFRPQIPHCRKVPGLNPGSVRVRLLII